MRTTVRWAVRGLAVAVALLVTAQPVLGPFALFRDGDPVDYETLHAVVGGILYNAVLLLVPLAPFTGFRRRWLLFGVCLAQYGLLHLQFPLGMASNDDAGLLAYHIPLGVLLLLLAYLTVALSFGLRFEPERT